MILLLGFLFAIEPDVKEARAVFYQDVSAYNESIDTYISQSTKYRNVKLSEEYRQKILNLERALLKGNKDVLQTVESQQRLMKDKVLLDDVLLMRLAQLEFDKANFEFTQVMARNPASAVNPNYKDAVEYATRLLLLYPDSSLADSAEYLVAYVHEELAEFDKAKKIYSYFLTKYPISQFYDEVQWRLAELQFESGEIKEARRNYLEIAKRPGSKFEFKALYKLGATLFDTGLYEWSSKMFVRLYDRLKDDTASSAERSTLYDETLEYLGLLSRKGVVVALSDEVRALSTKRIQEIFQRHGLWKESENVIIDYLKTYPLSKNVPELYARWIALYEARGMWKQAEAVRSEYFDKFVDKKDWWLSNKDNYQARFIAEEQIENNLLSSARYHADIKDWPTAIKRYHAFVEQYPYDKKTMQARLELAGIYYNSKKYRAAYDTLNENSVANIESSLASEIAYLKTSAYLSLNKVDPKKLFELGKSYIGLTDNYDKAASLIRAVIEKLVYLENLEEAKIMVGLFPYNRMEFSSAAVENFLKYVIRFEKKYNKAERLAYLERLFADISLRKTFDYKNYISKSFKTSYDDLQYYLINSDLDGFKNVQVKSSTQADQDVYHLMLAQILRNLNRYKESNGVLEKVESRHLASYRDLLSSKNYLNLLDFANSAARLKNIKNPQFVKRYPEYYKVTYDLKVLTQGIAASHQEALQLSKILKDESVAYDHLIRLPSKAKLAFIKAAKFSTKNCSDIMCSYVLWLQSSNKERFLSENYAAFESSSDKRFLFAIAQDILQLEPNLMASFPNIQTALQASQFSLGLKSFPQMIPVLKGWNVKSKHALIPWDLALHELVDWELPQTISNELNILLDSGRIDEVKRRLLVQRQTARETKMNLLKLFLYSQEYQKAKLSFSHLKNNLNENDYLALAYLLGFETDYKVTDSTQKNSKYVTYANAYWHLNQKDTRSAIEELMGIVQNSHDESPAYFYLLQAMLYIEDYQATSFLLSSYAKNTTSKFAIYAQNLLEGTYSEGGDFNLAQKALAKNEEFSSENPVIQRYYNLAKAWLENKTYDEGIEAFAGTRYLVQLVNKNPSDLTNAYFIKDTFEQRGIANEKIEKGAE